MSHATVLVAVADCQRRQIERKVAFEMEPFMEGGCFDEGSRWDWYVIGGRWSGLLNEDNIIRRSDVDAVMKTKRWSDVPGDFPSHFAFLYRRSWHERERMGWWGMPAKTECQIKKPGFKGKCLYEHKKSKARVVSWGQGDREWDLKFFSRFVRPLPPDTWLVTVDYHV